MKLSVRLLLCLLPALLLALLILILCLMPGKNLPHAGWLEAIHADKIVHFGLFFVLNLLLLGGWYYPAGKRTSRNPGLSFAAGTTLCFAYGWLIEFLQRWLTTDRMFEWQDAAADSAGALVAVLCFQRWVHRHPLIIKKNKP